MGRQKSETDLEDWIDKYMHRLGPLIRFINGLRIIFAALVLQALLVLAVCFATLNTSSGTFYLTQFITFDALGLGLRNRLQLTFCFRE